MLTLLLARILQERKEIPEAEKLYIRGESPDLAVRMYLDLQRWEDALRVAKAFSPHMVREVNLGWANALSGAGSANAKQSAQIWVDSGEFNKAIDVYLKASQTNTESTEEMKWCWMQAFKYANIHLRERLFEVSLSMCRETLAQSCLPRSLRLSGVVSNPCACSQKLLTSMKRWKWRRRP